MSQRNIKMRQSTDGIQYETLETPCEVSFEAISVSKNEKVSDHGGFPVYHIYVKCNEIAEKLLPLDANPREPRTTSQVKAMKKELRDTPSDFVKKNNGLTVLSRGVKVEDEQVKLIFESDSEGVCNGGHTYFSIKNTEFEIDNDTVAHLEVIEIPKMTEKDQEIVDIARARNNNNSLKRKSEADFLGYYDKFKDFLQDDSLVSWHEGDSNAAEYAVDATHLIRMCYALNPLEFKHSEYKPGASNHMQTARASSKFHRKWFNKKADDGEDELSHMLPLLNDLFYLRDYLSYSLLHENGYWGGFRKTSLYQEYINRNKPRDLHIGQYQGEDGAKLPNTLEVMLLGLFRSNVYIYYDNDGDKEYIGWVKDPEELWEDRRENIMRSWADYYNEAGGDPQVFIRSSAAYEKEIFKLGTGQEWPNPEILYSIEDGTKYRKTGDEPSYALDTNEGRGMMKLENIEPEDLPLYEKV